jgi:hypothetical protein
VTGKVAEHIYAVLYMIIHLVVEVRLNDKDIILAVK